MPDIEARRFCSILDNYGLTQHVNEATHEGGYTPYLVICRESSSFIVDAPSVCDPCLSSNTDISFDDHLTVQFVINADKPDCIYDDRSHTENIVE